MAELTVRNRIMEHLKERFEGIEAGIDDYTVTWNTIARRPLSDIEMQTGDALALIDRGEAKSEEIGYMRSVMEVLTEFWIRVDFEEDPSVRLNEVLGEVQRTMRSDINSTVTTVPLCQLTINITEVRNELDVEGPGDNLVGGVVAWEVVYRHQSNDPRKLIGE